jgi:hypothetical protein
VNSRFDPVMTDHFERAEELFARLGPNDERWYPDLRGWMFRGQADESWELVPTILRGDPPLWRSYLDTDPEPPDGNDPSFSRRLAEITAVLAFMRAADQAGLAIPDDDQELRHEAVEISTEGEWPPVRLLSIAGLAQHYGVPTRLLDWTWKPRVAAYFAARDAAFATEPFGSGRLAIWCAKHRSMTLIGRGRARFDSMSIVTAPQASNANLAAQAGLFTVVRDAHEGETLDSVIIKSIREKKSFDDDLLPVMRKLTLPHSQARRLLRMLALDDVSAATVFPGYAGVTRSLEEKRRWEK